MITLDAYVPAGDLPPPRTAFLRALTLLLRAYEYALELGQSPLEFAVEIQCLRDAGLTNSDFRWLCCKGHVEHAVETTKPDDKHRIFEPGTNLCFHERTCFVLTEDGCRLARRCCASGASPASANLASCHPLTERPADGRQVPTWDRDRQELRLGARVVKRFKAPAPNQEAILSAFEEDGWPTRIDDPIPPQIDQDPKRRLHDTINALNRNQKNRLIRFLGDGSGQGVRWEQVFQAYLTGAREACTNGSQE